MRAWRANGEWIAAAGVGAALAAALAVGPRAAMIGLAVVGALALPIAFALGALRDRDARCVVQGLFLAAVAARVIVALTIEFGAPRGFFALDDHRYELLGRALARAWSGEGPMPQDLPTSHGYFLWNALWFWLLEDDGLVPALVNAVAGGLVVVLTWRITREIGGARAARHAAWLAAFWPSLVLWSSLNLKDAWAIVAILLCLHGAQRLEKRLLSVAGLLALGIGALVLGELRPYLLTVMAAALAISWVVLRLRRVHGPVVVAVLLTMGAVAGPALGPVESLSDEISLASLDRARTNLAIGASAYYGDVDISTPATALRFLPVGLAYFLLAPAPWQVDNLRQLLTLPEMLLWYALLPAVWIGVRSALRARAPGALPVALFGLFATVSYALVEANLGTAYRHRAQVIVLFLIFGAVGLARRRERRGAHRGAAPPAPRVRAGRPALEPAGARA